MSLPRVTACVVTYQSATSLSLCLNAFFAQKGVEPRAIVVDNASTDGSADIAEKFDAATVARLAENSGFAAGMNRAIAQADTDLILLLNPDVVLSESAAATLAAALSGAPSDVAAVQPKLVSPHSDPPRLDSTGIELRLFRLDPRDRGHGEIDTGRYDAARGVFGVTGACSLWRRSVLAGLAIGGEVFDEGFFAYYEDVDLCWRAGRFGYRFLYCPEAQATHPRRNPPAHGPHIDALAFANRYLTVFKNASGIEIAAVLTLNLPFEVPRWIVRTLTRPGFGAAWRQLAGQMAKALRSRREIQRRYPLRRPR